jgi:CBS domain containing-hemolysin-like protein
VANARAELDEVRAVVGPDFDPGEHAEDVETIGGLVFDLVGRVPVKGEIISRLKGFDVEVLQSDPRQLKRLMIRRVAKPARRKVGNTGQAAAE